MKIWKWLSGSDNCQGFPTHEALFEGLAAGHNLAILCLQSKALPMMRKLCKGYQLTGSQVEEVLNKSTLIFLQKIEQGGYQFQGHAPSTYLVEVAKRVARDASRKQGRNRYEPLEEHQDIKDPDLAAAEKQQAAAELIRNFLGQLSDACAQVIRLYHIDGYSDLEVIQQNRSSHASVAALKVKRSGCMKKLIKIAQQWKISNPI